MMAHHPTQVSDLKNLAPGWNAQQRDFLKNKLGGFFSLMQKKNKSCKVLVIYHPALSP